MEVEGKTILQTTERTELTGKEGIPFQEGVQNGHVFVERLKEYVGEGLVKEDGLKTINGEKLTGIGDITFESDAGKPVILRYPKYNETSDDSTMLEKANSGEWFCTLPQMLENYNDGNLKAPFIGVQDDTNENFSPVTCYRIYSASNYYFMLYFLESNNNMEIQFRGFRMKYDPQDLTKWTGVFDNGTVRLSLASASNDGLMSKEDKEKLDGIQFNTNENSILFGEKKYGATLFKNVFGLSTSSSNEEIKTALGGNTYDDIFQMVNRGILFLNINNKALQHVMIRIENKGSSEGDYLHIQGFSDASDTAYMKIRHYSGSFNITENVKRDKLLFKSGIVNELVATITDLPLSAAMGKALNDKIAEISNPASAEKDGLMSKEDKEAFDYMKDGGAIEYKEISGQTVDADDLIVPKLTVRYLNKNASTAENISNIPAKGGFVLESMCVRYVDEDNCGYIQTYYSQNSDSRILPFSLTRQYTNGKWTEWRSTVGRYLCVNEAYEKVGTTFLGTGFQVGNIFDRSIVKDGALAISTQDVSLHLTGVKNSTTYKVVSNSSVGY